MDGWVCMQSRLQVQALPRLGCIPLVLFQLLKEQPWEWTTTCSFPQATFTFFLLCGCCAFRWQSQQPVSDVVGDKPSAHDTAAGQWCGRPYLRGCNHRTSPAKKAITANLLYVSTGQKVTMRQRLYGVMFSAAGQKNVLSAQKPWHFPTRGLWCSSTLTLKVSIRN